MAEDYDDGRFMMGRLFETSGYRVLEAADGREAVKIAERGCPDVVLTDLQMPVLDGFTATRVGCDRFVSKPVDFDQLPELVRGVRKGRAPKPSRTRPSP